MKAKLLYWSDKTKQEINKFKINGNTWEAVLNGVHGMYTTDFTFVTIDFF